MPRSTENWHRTSVAIRTEHVDQLQLLLDGLNVRSVSELLGVIVTSDPAAITKALTPFVNKAHATRNAGKAARELADRVKQLKDPALVAKINAQLEKA